MPFEKLLRVVFQNIARSKKNFIFSSIGIIVGITTYTFFLALSEGIQDRVLNRIFPIDQLEVEPIGGVAASASDATGDTSGGMGDVLGGGPRRLDTQAITQLAATPGVAKAYPKMRARFPGKIETGVLDRRMAGEGFVEGLEVSPAVLDEMKAFEAQCSEEDQDVCKRREVSCVTDAECPHEGMACVDAAGEPMGPASGTSRGVCKPREYWRAFTDRTPAGACTQSSECGAGNVCGVDRWIILKVRDKAHIEPIKTAVAALTHPTLDLDYYVAIADVGDVVPGDAIAAERVQGEVWRLGADFAAGAEAELAQRKVTLRTFTDVAGVTAHLASLATTLTAGTCLGTPCQLEQAEDQIGHWLYFDVYDNHRGNCDPGRYCAARNVLSVEGRCEAYLPAALNPLMIDFYNSNVVSQLGTQPLPNPCFILGLKGYFRFGFSFLRDDFDTVWQKIRWAEIVGFTDKAMHLGGTVPLPYVERLNRFYLGPDSTTFYDSVLLQIPRNEDVAGVIEGIQKQSFDLSRSSAFARKAGEMLMIVTLTFLLISIIIIIISAMNISHTFLMVVFERQRELGVLRAIGATRWDIRRIILSESLFIGVTAGIVGNLLSYGVSRLVNLGAGSLRERFPMIPDDFFVYGWPLVLGSMAFAVLFCVIGAWIPANRAAKLDPAVVLTQA